MSQSRPFPAVTGGCCCGAVRYRMETAPLYCFACHCTDCQRQTGSVFAAFASIEADRVKSIGRTTPQKVSITRPSGASKQVFACPTCKAIVWDANGIFSLAVISIRIGTLDIPSLMEPDMHMYVESKVSWLPLPKDAKICKGTFKESEVWPKSSLERLDACRAKFEAEKKNPLQEAAKEGDETQEDSEAQTDTTPTMESPEANDLDERDADKEFEKRQKALEERLEMLTLKMKNQGRI